MEMNRHDGPKERLGPFTGDRSQVGSRAGAARPRIADGWQLSGSEGDHHLSHFERSQPSGTGGSWKREVPGLGGPDHPIVDCERSGGMALHLKIFAAEITDVDGEQCTFGRIRPYGIVLTSGENSHGDKGAEPQVNRHPVPGTPA
jgi:hypothetical protein